MGLIERLYKWKHGERPDPVGEQQDSVCDNSCNDHNFGEWKPRDRSNSKLLDDNSSYHDYSFDLKLVSVKYRRSKKSGKRNSKVDKSNPTVVPYSDVATIWCKLSGQQYGLITINKIHYRECHCGEKQSGSRPVKYIAVHTDTIIGTAEMRSEIDDIIISHNNKFE